MSQGQGMWSTSNDDIMAPRITSSIAKSLAPYIKSLHLTGDFFCPNSKSAYEFYRQMSSPNLLKINPKLDVKLTEVDFMKADPVLKAEFADGSKHEFVTKGKTAADLRFEIFSIAAEVEDLVDDGGADDAASKKNEKGKGKK